MNLVPFTYTNGHSGFVPSEALTTFQRKDRAVQRVMVLRTPGAQAVDGGELERCMRTIQSANRTMDHRGWYFYGQAQADAIAKQEALRDEATRLADAFTNIAKASDTCDAAPVYLLKMAAESMRQSLNLAKDGLTDRAAAYRAAAAELSRRALVA